MNQIIEWIRKGKHQWLKIAIVAIIPYLVITSLTTYTLQRRTDFLDAQMMIEQYSHMDNMYTASTWGRYEKCIRVLEDVSNTPLVPSTTLMHALADARTARNKLAVNDSMSVTLPYDEIMRYPDSVRGSLVKFRGKIIHIAESSLGYLVYYVELDGNDDHVVYLAIPEGQSSNEPCKLGDHLEAIGVSKGVYEVSGRSTKGSMPYVLSSVIINLTNLNSR